MKSLKMSTHGVQERMPKNTETNGWAFSSAWAEFIAMFFYVHGKQ